MMILAAVVSPQDPFLKGCRNVSSPEQGAGAFKGQDLCVRALPPANKKVPIPEEGRENG